MAKRPPAVQYLEATCAIAALTGIAWAAPGGYRAFSLVYLLSLVAMSLRLNRGPLLTAAVLSALAWDFFVIPPRYSFRIGAVEDTAMLGAYVIVALITSELTSRIRTQGEHLGAIRERAKMLTESDQLHRALFDSVSHELKTPITVLRSAATALRQRTTGESAELADEVFQATDRLNRLVGNLLDQTRLESGMLVPRLDWCDSGELIEAARSSLRKVLAGHDLRVEIAADAVLLHVDGPLLEQAIENILLNAALYSPPGKTITVRCGVEFRRNQAFISVADEGPGISNELRKKLFQKFQRGHSAHSGGLGLGLSIVHGFVTAQGGEVEAVNNEQGGATFTVYLPIVPSETVPDN